MKCEDCQELLSDYIDQQLDVKNSARVKAHLALCGECAEVHEDFANIIGLCEIEITEELPPPNEQALWCRINNIIESEIKPEITQQLKAKEEQKSWVSRLWGKTWALSLTQLTSAVLGIALVSSLLTVIGVKTLSSSSNDFSATASNQPTLFDRVLSKVGLAESPQQTRERKIREQQAAIDYWNNRVTARRVQWDKNLRDAFDRNLNEINQVVAEYSQTVEANPQDDFSGELLDSALDEKVELLREFSEL